MRLFVIPALLALAACTTPDTRVRTIEVPIESLAPCPATRPVRPDPLGPLPADAIAALATVSSKLAEYSAPGKYADMAEAYFDTCPSAPIALPE